MDDDRTNTMTTNHKPLLANTMTILGFLGTVYILYYFTHRLDSTPIVSLFILLLGISVACFAKGVSMVR